VVDDVVGAFDGVGCTVSTSEAPALGGGDHTVVGGLNPGVVGVPLTSVVGILPGVDGGGLSSVDPPGAEVGGSGDVTGGVVTGGVVTGGVVTVSPGSSVGGESTPPPGGDVGDCGAGRVVGCSGGLAGHGMTGRSGAGRNDGVVDGRVVLPDVYSVESTTGGRGKPVLGAAEEPRVLVDGAPIGLSSPAGTFTASTSSDVVPAEPAGETPESLLGVRVWMPYANTIPPTSKAPASALP
jgi:hypothetical protein